MPEPSYTEIDDDRRVAVTGIVKVEAPPGGYGQVILTRTRGLDDVLTVQQADPVALIAPELLREARQPNPWATVDGDVLTIRATNRTVIYRISEWLPERNAFRMEWPD